MGGPVKTGRAGPIVTPMCSLPAPVQTPRGRDALACSAPGLLRQGRGHWDGVLHGSLALSPRERS